MKMAVCSAANLFVILLCIQLVSAQLSADQVSSMTSIYEIIRNDTVQDGLYPYSFFVWRKVWKYSDPCSWEGVGCSPDNSSINTISFQSFSISTEIFPFLCNISTLESLDVSYNRLSSIPDGFFTACGEISGLKLLNFSGNDLRGPLPTFNNGFRVLEKLDFSGNSLSGEISLQLDGLDSRKILDLRWNEFRGKIPTNLGKMNLLEELFLSANLFTGEIPIEITKYKNLREIDLSGNLISGSVPSEFGEFTKLQTWDLSNNNLIGGIPSSLSNITTLESFAAEQNYLHGTIPSLITRHLKYLDLSYNNLTGFMPSHHLPAPNLQKVYLSFNDLAGLIPTFNSTTMRCLEMDNNRLRSLPPSLGNLTNLEVLSLESNNFAGEIPLEIAQLTRLWWLNLGGNSLDGSIPWWISRMHNLRWLNLQRNNLRGPIPDSIRNLSSLLELQLENNQLSGTIPSMPASLQYYLNLSHNLFQGPIPNTLSRLKDLEVLEMQGNNLVGSIPSSLSALSRLQVLDLSNNRLSGEIPNFLAESRWLFQLLLMNNDLSGVVPRFGNYVIVDTSGNKDLIYPSPPMILTPLKKIKPSMFNSEIAIAVASGFPVGLVISVIAIFISRKYRRIHHHLSPPSSILRSAIDLKKGMEAVSDPSNITLKARFLTFYKAVMPSGSTYLVKKINHSNSIFKFPRNTEFSKELEVLGNLSHPNVMIPKAYVLTLCRAYLFYDFARGTLHDILHRRMGNSTLDWASRYSIVVGVAKGLAYLHECTSGPVLLLELSTKSIMLKSLDEPQISDIELSKIIHPSNGAASVGYIPPEYTSTTRATAAGNVYSFGVVVLELLTGKPAVSSEGTELTESVLRISDQREGWDQVLDSSVSETSVAARTQMLAVLEVAFACISMSPEIRPNAVTVVQMLQSRR